MCQNFVRKLRGQELEDRIVDAIDLFRAKSADFTAHQITLKVRELVGPTVEVDHLDVRPLVHDMMFVTIDYTKDIHSGGAILYRFNQVTDLAPTGKMQVFFPPITPIVGDAVKKFNELTKDQISKLFAKKNGLHAIKGTTKGLDSRGSLVVPGNVVKKAANKERKFKVSMRTSSETRLIPATTTPPNFKLGALDYYTRYGDNIRVTKRNLPAGFKTFNVFVNNGGEIVIQGVA